MGYFQLQGRFGLSEPVHSPFRRASKNQSSLVLGIIIFVHVAIILFVLNQKIKQRELIPEKILHMINLLPEKVEPMLEPKKPEIMIEPRQLQLTTPQLQFSETVLSPLNSLTNDLPYEFPSGNSGQYENIFDPKLRKKLIDAQHLNTPRKAEKSKSWTTSDGRTFVDIGDGMCLVSMPNLDSHSRGKNWGKTRCGKTDSEKMMDNVNADLEARKHPLNKKGQQ